MKEIKNRRVFLQYAAKGILTGILTFGYFKYGKSFEWIRSGSQVNDQIPKINPAYKVNVLTDGTVELYTHKYNGERIVFPVKGFEADILLSIIKNMDPKLYTRELGLKYSLEENDFISLVESTIKTMEDKGFIYYGEDMLVKVKQAKNE